MVFDQFTELVSGASGWAYGVVFLVAFLDAVLPVVPSETVVITAGVVAAAGDLSLGLIIVMAAGGAFAGDNFAYLLGHRYGSWARERFFRGAKAQKRIAWAEQQLGERGGELIVVARFIPAGRTAVTLGAGMLGYPWRRFVFFDAVAATLWASYAALLGYFGGRTFEDAAWKGLLFALAIALAVVGGVELTRWYLRRRAARGRPAPTER